jgi:hypothetical protein
MSRFRFAPLLFLVFAPVALAVTPPAAKTPPPSAPALRTLDPIPIALPGGTGGIGFDDLQFAPALGKLLVPAGGTGNLALIDPATHAVATIGGFHPAAGFSGGHDVGTTSADEGRGYLFAIDHSTKRVDVIDPAAGKIVAGADLAGSPDYVRYVAATNEVWVTEPDGERIEIFALAKSKPPIPEHVAFVAVPGGPEALQIDAARGRGYSNLWKEKTVAIDLVKRTVVATWDNGCTGARGLALDAQRSFLFVACAEGGASVLDLKHDAKRLDHAESGAGVDIIAFDAGLSHLYVPGGKAETMTVFAVGNDGHLTPVATAKTAPKAHCVATDDRHQVYVCDPTAGLVLMYKDGG